jgi:hypothetical protein
MLVNLTNSFDLPEITEEQEELKKLGKRPLPSSSAALVWLPASAPRV